MTTAREPGAESVPLDTIICVDGSTVLDLEE